LGRLIDITGPGALNEITPIGRERLDYRAALRPKARRLKAVLYTLSSDVVSKPNAPMSVVLIQEGARTEVEEVDIATRFEPIFKAEHLAHAQVDDVCRPPRLLI